MLTTVVLATLLSASQDADPAAFAGFMQQVQKVSGDYSRAEPTASRLLDAGHVDEAGEFLLEAVPEDSRTAAHAFVLGNRLHRLNPDIAFDLHRVAYEMAPEQALTRLEWGLELHQEGDHEAALALYEKVDEQLTAIIGPGNDTQLGSWRFDALIALGRLDEALKVWDAMDVRRTHTEVETAFHALHAKLHPLQRRAELLRFIEAGEMDRIEELILLDLNFDTDWWNSSRMDDLLEQDLRRARDLLEEEPLRMGGIDLLVELQPGDELDDMFLGFDPEEASRTRARLEEQGLLGNTARLPVSSRLARTLFGDLTISGRVDAEQWLETHGAALEARARSHDGDQEAFMLLVALHASAKSPRVEELELLGWERYSHEDSAYGLLTRKTPLSADSPLLIEALKTHPESRLILLQLVRATEDDPATHIEALRRSIAAELKHLSSYRRVQPQIERLREALKR